MTDRTSPLNPFRSATFTPGRAESPLDRDARIARENRARHAEAQRCSWTGCRQRKSRAGLCETHVKRALTELRAVPVEQAHADYVAQAKAETTQVTVAIAQLQADVAARDEYIAQLEERLARISEHRGGDKPRPTDGTIYYVDSGSLIKIGWTADLAKRMRQYPPTARLLATHSGTRADEAHLKKRFAVHCTSGKEWFAHVGPLLEHIDSVVTEHGAPPDVVMGPARTKPPQPRPKAYITTRDHRGRKSTA